jgi:hypothetical protein
MPFMILALALLSGCGGDSDSSSDTRVLIEGRVIDGPIQDARVCLDINRDKACGSGEPDAVTDADGRFAITVDIPVGMTEPRVLLAVIDAATAKDVEDGGKTLAQAGKPSAVFQALVVDRAPVVVSALTTFVVNEMETRWLAADEAARVVAGTLGLADAGDLGQDFSAAATDVQRVLKQIARAGYLAQGHIRAGLLQAGSGASARTLQLASLTEALPVAAYLADQLELTRPRSDDPQPLILDILASTFSAGMYADLAYSGAMLRNAAAEPSAVSDIVGKVWAMVRDIGAMAYEPTCCFFGVGTLDFATSGVQYQRSAYVGGTWLTQPDYELDLFDLNQSTGAWIRRPPYGTLGDVAMSQPGRGAYTARHSGLIVHHAYREADISGKTLADIEEDRKSTRLNSSHNSESRMPSSA